MSNGRDSSREDFWRHLIQRRADSGMTIANFCEKEGLKPTTYQYWHREIRRRDLESTVADPSNSNLTAVHVVDDRQDHTCVEIVAKNGYVVRIGDQAATEHVRRVLQAVSELS